MKKLILSLVMLGVSSFAFADPVITQPLASVTAQAGNTVTFTAQATGTAPLYYQWRQEVPGGTKFVNIGFASTKSSYTTPVLTLANSGTSYTFYVMNSKGMVSTSSAILTVIPGVVVPPVPVVTITITNSSLNCSSPSVCNGDATCLSQCTNISGGVQLVH